MRTMFDSILVVTRRRISLILIAFMLGMSNVFLEESRSINDTREHIEQPELLPDEDLTDTTNYIPDF